MKISWTISAAGQISIEKYSTPSIFLAEYLGELLELNYCDLGKMYHAGEYRKVNFTAADIERGKESVLSLVPGR